MGTSCVGTTAHTALSQVTLQSTEPCQESAPSGYAALCHGKWWQSLGMEAFEATIINYSKHAKTLYF